MSYLLCALSGWIVGRAIAPLVIPRLWRLNIRYHQWRERRRGETGPIRYSKYLEALLDAYENKA